MMSIVNSNSRHIKTLSFKLYIVHMMYIWFCDFAKIQISHRWTHWNEMLGIKSFFGSHFGNSLTSVIDWTLMVNNCLVPKPKFWQHFPCNVSPFLLQIPCDGITYPKMVPALLLCCWYLCHCNQGFINIWIEHCRLAMSCLGVHRRLGLID